MTCEFCGTYQEQHDHWRHLIMGRMAALEGFVCKAGEQVDKLAETESERVWAEIRAMADRVAALEIRLAARESFETGKTEPPASGQLASAGETTVPPGWKLAPGWSERHPEDHSECTWGLTRWQSGCQLRHAFQGDNGMACPIHAERMGAIVPAEPLAEQPSRQETGRCCRRRCRCITRIDDDVRCEACFEAGCLIGRGDKCEVPKAAEQAPLPDVTESQESALMGHQQAALLRRIDELHAKLAATEASRNYYHDDRNDLEAQLAQAEKDVRHWQDEAADRLNEAAQAKRDRDERGRQIEQMAEHVAKMRVERDEATARERERVDSWWRAWVGNRTPISSDERNMGIASGAHAPKCDPDPPREEREGRTHLHRLIAASSSRSREESKTEPTPVVAPARTQPK